MLWILVHSPIAADRGYFALRSLFVSTAILITIVGCGGEQPQGNAGQDRTSGKRDEMQTEMTTAQPKDAEDRSEAGAKTDSEDDGDRSDRGARSQAGNDQAQAGNAVSGNEKARTGDAAAGAGKARAGNIVVGDGGDAEAVANGGSPAGKARLRISGSPGTAFSGTCDVGGKKEDISGRTPEKFVYRLRGKKLECSIRPRGPGRLEIALSGDGTRAVQAINAGQGSVNLTYSSSGVSVSSR